MSVGYCDDHDSIGESEEQLKTAARVLMDENVVTRVRMWGAEDFSEAVDQTFLREQGLVFKLLDNADAYSKAQCRTLAQRALDESQALQDTVSFSGALWPHIEREDQIHITESRTGVDDDFIVSTLKFELRPGALDMKIEARS